MIMPGTCPCGGVTIPYEHLIKLMCKKGSALKKYGVKDYYKRKNMDKRVWEYGFLFVCPACQQYFWIQSTRKFKKDRDKKGIAKMVYRCRRCEIEFRCEEKYYDPRVEVINNINSPERKCLIIAHNCYDGGVGVADLIGAD